jgi:SAM-dependent methyltransferase
VYQIKEMMYGLRESFTYFECLTCGCLQITTIPLDMSKYYPSDYYSFKTKKESSLYDVLLRSRDNYVLFHKGFFGKLINHWYSNPALSALSCIHLSKSSRILDVGCGAGQILQSLKQIGFNNLLGIDKYLAQDMVLNGVELRRQELPQTAGEWDLIMFHHSFEHIPNQLETLGAAANCLADEGICLISIPTVSSYAWKHYRENWVQLDAPRHFYLHSLKSMSLIARKSGLCIAKIAYNSTAFQFWGSELYVKNIPLSTGARFFSKSALKEFNGKARELNALNQGDSAVFYLTKSH